MQIGKICKTLGYGGILCSALVFANPCHGDNQFIFDATNALYAPSTSPFIINQYVSEEFAAGQNADAGELLFQNSAALTIDVSATSAANALALYNGIDFKMYAGNGSDITSAGALTLTGGTSDGSTYNGSAILVQRENDYSTYWDANRNTAVDGTYTQAAANLAKAITTNITLESSANQTITGQYGIKIVGLRSASAGYGTTNATTDYAGDTVNITLGGTGTNSISGTSGAIYRDSTSGIVNAAVADSSTWSLTGDSNVDSLTLGNGSTLNLKLQGTPADNTSGGSVMSVNTELNLPTGENDSATVGLEWQKVSNPANAEAISQSYLVLPSGNKDWTKLNLNLIHIGDPVGSGTDWKLDEGDKILLVSGNDLSSSTEFPLGNLLFNATATAPSAWFTDGSEGAFELLRYGGNLYAKVVSDSLKISHYSYPTGMTKRVLIYPRFATVGHIPSLKVSFDDTDGPADDCNNLYAHRSHLDIKGNSLAYDTSDKAAVTIMNNYTLDGTVDSTTVTGIWSDAKGLENIATDQACDVLITIVNGKAISRTPSTGDAIAITSSVDNSYVPAMRIAAAGTGAITATSVDGNAYGVKLEGTSFAADDAGYVWGVYSGFDTTDVTGYAYRFEVPITATATTGHSAYGIYMTSATDNVGATVLITKDISATGGTINYAVYGKNTDETNPRDFTFHFGGSTSTGSNIVKTTGNLSGQFVVNGYTTLYINSETNITGKLTTDVNGTANFDAKTTIVGDLTDNGVVAINANVTQTGSLTGTGNITVGAASKAAVFDCSGTDCELTLEPNSGAAIACATEHTGIVAIKTLTGGTTDHFGDATNGAFTGVVGSKLLLAGKGGTVDGSINGFEKLIFGYHQGAPELNYDTDKIIDLGTTNDDDTNAWTLNDAVTGKDIIVRHGLIKAKGTVNLSGQLYVLGCNFCTTGMVNIAGGEYSHEETLRFAAGSEVTISNKASDSVITALTIDGNQITPEHLNDILSNDKKQFLADIVLGSSTEKGGAQLVVDSNAVTLNSITVDGENIGILAVGENNVIALNSAPEIKYYSTYTDDTTNELVPDYTNCYAIKGNESTKLDVSLSQTSVLNGKVDVGEILIDTTGEKLTLTNNAASDGDGVLATNKLTVYCLRINSDGNLATSIPAEAKLEVATLKPFSNDKIDVQIEHLGGLVAGNKIPLVKCDNVVTLVAKQTFLTQYAIIYDKTSYSATAANGYVATVTNSMTNGQAASKLGLNASYGRMLDSWHCTSMQFSYLNMMYGADEQTYTTVSNWSARSDHMEKARITSSMMSAYNEVMLARRGVHNFDQEHKLISWISGFGDWFKQGEIKNLGAKSNTYGIIAGADYQLNDKWLFSLSCGYANSDVKLNGNHNCYSGSGHQDSFVSSATMTYKNKLGNGALSATGLFTSAFVRNKYNYSFKTTEDEVVANNTGHEKYHSFAGALGLDADWMLNYKDTAIKYGPIVQVGFDRTSQDGHTTTCSDSKLGFKTDEANVNNLWSILGAKVEYDCMLQQKKVNIYCQAGWKFQYLRNGANVGRELALDAGSENKSFTATGTYVDKSMFALKLGASLFATESFNLGVEYGLDYNSKVHSNRANVEMTYQF